MNKGPKSSGTAVFYKPPTSATKIRSGYLFKSPPQKRMKTEKSWKKRYFVLYKISEKEYQFKYSRSPKEIDRPLGGIDLSQVSLLHVNPEHHCTWGTVYKTMKCSPACVLYIKTADRDFFLVAQSSEEVDGWFCDLFDALKTRPHKFFSSEDENPPEQVTAEVSSPSVGEMGQPTLPLPAPKPRSLSYPFLHDTAMSPKKDEKFFKRRASEPVEPMYSSPRSYLKLNETDAAYVSMDSVYEKMDIFALDQEVAEINSDSLLMSLSCAFDKMKTELPSFAEETAAEDRDDKCQSSEFSSSSSDTLSPVEMDKRMPECSDRRFTAEEREFVVKPADLKKHLKLTELDGRPSVCGWTGQPQTVCLFHKGDLILAINDLHTSSMEEFNMFISKSLKNEVKLTILRLPGQQPFHLPNCPCSD